MPRFSIFVALAIACALAHNGAPAGEKKLVEPSNLGKVNTKADEDDPFVLATNTSLLYASNASGNWSILMSQRQGKNWQAGKVFPGLVAKDVDFRSPFVARDNKLYYATNEVPDEKLKNLKNFDLKVRVGGREALPILGVSDKGDELHPWITPGGKEFYFSRKTADGWMLLVARGPVPGPVGNAKAVGFPAGFHHASLSNSGLVMYLQGPVQKERTGLFRARRSKVGAAWSAPELLTMLNGTEGPRGDMSPCLSSDGTRLYFASDRPGGAGGLDLWSVETAQLKAK